MALLPRDEIVQLVRTSSTWDGMQERCGTGQKSIDDMLGLLQRKNHGKMAVILLRHASTR
jgi:hypothetical protein